ncbi:hypothetical protein H072_5560 [Dactylellina haptotyla CBS 200.50]|uniref:Uncharacterized protein n=1 Tax=Dactylellina haptotyla (strain CBS 200.50) TaxID=1284197 RepID=S8ACB2_DACHA|nr:hypothetical protein H072_5560 [Dactylellina haptotyla CBS 200.50]
MAGGRWTVTVDEGWQVPRGCLSSFSPSNKPQPRLLQPNPTNPTASFCLRIVYRYYLSLPTALWTSHLAPAPSSVQLLASPPDPCPPELSLPSLNAPAVAAIAVAVLGAAGRFCPVDSPRPPPGRLPYQNILAQTSCDL